jgi:uncharacterized membrane protein YfcA
MSNYENHHADDVPRFEPWLGVMLSAFAPAIVVLYLPPTYLVPLVTITAILFAAGLFMLRRQTLRRAREHGDARRPSGTPAARSFEGETLEMEGAEP